MFCSKVIINPNCVLKWSIKDRIIYGNGNSNFLPSFLDFESLFSSEDLLLSGPFLLSWLLLLEDPSLLFLSVDPSLLFLSVDPSLLFLSVDPSLLFLSVDPSLLFLSV